MILDDRLVLYLVGWLLVVFFTAKADSVSVSSPAAPAFIPLGRMLVADPASNSNELRFGLTSLKLIPRGFLDTSDCPEELEGRAAAVLIGEAVSSAKHVETGAGLLGVSTTSSMSAMRTS